MKNIITIGIFNYVVGNALLWIDVYRTFKLTNLEFWNHIFVGGLFLSLIGIILIIEGIRYKTSQKEKK